MTSEVQFWDPQIWELMIALGLLFGAMLLANLLRRKIGIINRSLIPSAVFGGFLMLVVIGIYSALTGRPLFNTTTLEAITYHGLGLGLVALSFRTTEKASGKERLRDIFNTGVTTVATYLMQGIMGLGITLGLSYVLGNWAASGILLPMGFGQGPGQAFNWGVIYQTATDYPPFEHGASFGLSVAALGFVASSIGGVIYLQRMRKQGLLKGEIGLDQKGEDLSLDMVSRKDEIPIAESLDKLTVQFGLVFMAYMLGYGLMYLISLGLDALGGFFSGTVKPLIWGFNFLFGMLFAGLIKSVMRKLKEKGHMNREYTNNFMLNRISGLTFDLMVVTSIAAINLSAFRYKEFIIPLLAICIAGTVGTYWFLDFICRSLFPKYEQEQFLAMYGMLTGTASTGLILLRQIDPQYKTPASSNLVYQNLWAIVFGFPMLLLLGVVAQSLLMSWITLGLITLLLVAMMIILFRSRIFKKKSAE